MRGCVGGVVEKLIHKNTNIKEQILFESLVKVRIKKPYLE